MINSGGVTTYGTTTSNPNSPRQSGRVSSSGRDRSFADRITYKSPFSMLVVCLGVLIVFALIICLSALGGKGQKSEHHAPPGSHHKLHALNVPIRKKTDFQVLVFLDASSHLYKRVCPSVRPNVCPSVCPLPLRKKHRGTHLIARPGLLGMKRFAG